MIYDFIKDYVMNNDDISESRKYDAYKAIKKDTSTLQRMTTSIFAILSMVVLTVLVSVQLHVNTQENCSSIHKKKWTLFLIFC